MVEIVFIIIAILAGAYIVRKLYELYILIKLANYIAKGDKEKAKNDGDGIY